MSVRLYITGIDFLKQTVEMSINPNDLDTHLELVTMLRLFSDEKSQRRIKFLLKSSKPISVVVP